MKRTVHNAQKLICITNSIDIIQNRHYNEINQKQSNSHITVIERKGDE